jgi:hypothetical protein
MTAAFKTAKRQPTPAERVSSWPTAGSPIYLGYRVEIPEEWQALCVVWCPMPPAPRIQDQPDSLSVVNSGSQRFQVSVLLCRPGTDGREAAQKFRSHDDWEAACLDQDGQYLRPAQTRPAFAVLPLGAPSPTCPDQKQRSECLVLMPSIRLPFSDVETLPPIRMFVDGHEVGAPA